MTPSAETMSYAAKWLLHSVLPRKALEKLASRLGLKYSGTRLAAVPSEEIADALMERWAEPEVRLAITSILDRSLPDERPLVERADGLQEVAREVLRDPDKDRLGGFIWALVRSPRPEAQALAVGLIQTLDRLSLEDEATFAHVLAEEMASERAEAAAELKGVRQALRRSERERERLAHRVSQQHTRLADLEARVMALADERRALEQEARTLRRLEQQAKDAIEARARLEAQIAQNGGELAALRARLQVLEEERRGLLGDLEEMSRWLHRPPGRREGPDLLVGVFMDGENLLYSARAAFGTDARVSLSCVVKAAAAGRMLARAVAYVGRLPVEGNWEPLQPTLTAPAFPYQIRHHTPVRREGALWTGNWDVGVAVDILTQAGGLDVIVLATGDGDFLPLLTYCKRRGFRVEVMAFTGSDSSILAIAAHAYRDLGPEVLWAGGREAQAGQ